MASTITTNMGLILPTVGEEAGPTYGEDQNASMLLIDQHNHTSGYGAPVPVSGLDINADLPFANNNATNLKSSRFFVQGSALSGGSDLGCLYVTGVDLYYNDVNGNQIQITQSGGVAGTPGSIGSLVAPASATYVGATPAFVFQSAANTPASLDGGSVVLRNISANSKGLTLAPPNAMAADYTLTLPSLPAQTNVMTLDTSGNIGSTTYNAVANARTRSVGATVGVGGVAISVSSSGYSNSTTTFTDVFSCEITTSGRPVQICLIADATSSGIGATSGLSLSVNGSSSTGSSALLKFLRNATPVSLNIMQTISGSASVNVAISTPPGALNFVDDAPAGTYTYTLQAKIAVSGAIFVTNCKLVAYEL